MTNTDMLSFYPNFTCPFLDIQIAYLTVLYFGMRSFTLNCNGICFQFYKYFVWTIYLRIKKLLISSFTQSATVTFCVVSQKSLKGEEKRAMHTSLPCQQPNCIFCKNWGLLIVLCSIINPDMPWTGVQRSWLCPNIALHGAQNTVTDWQCAFMNEIPPKDKSGHPRGWRDQGMQNLYIFDTI